MTIKYIVGIDEAGRGPLAGPMAVGIVFMKKDAKLDTQGIRDSKKLSEKKRDEWFEKIKVWNSDQALQYTVVLTSPSDIDTHGLSWALAYSIKNGLKDLQVEPKNTHIYLDGGLRAPDEFKNQETIIKGDEKIPAISLASIAAKVTRDIYMKKVAHKYPEYGFEIHKGYGTKLHRDSIQKHGISPIHRKSFLKLLLSQSLDKSIQ